MSDQKVSMSGLEAEFMDIAGKNAWASIYQKVTQESQANSYTVTEAKKVHNKHLNRYRDVNPYDHSRIILQRTDVDYINANLVTLERANRRYILTQGPLAFTVDHFWLMVWEQNSRGILMLNKVMEKSELKCHHYWPPSEEEVMNLVAVGLTVTLLSTRESDNFSTRCLRIVDTASHESREILQFHYTTWPDFGVPSSPVALLQFLETVRESGALEENVGPAVVHCSAGIGRSGTFCLVDACLVIIEKEGPNNVNVQEVLLELRKSRMGLIQTPDQLRFSYQAIIEGARRIDPNYVPRVEAENIYAVVAEEEAPPPPLPRRVASLAERRPPARPLPAIPASVSAGQLSVHGDLSSSDSELDIGLRPPRHVSPYVSSHSSDDDDAGSGNAEAAGDTVGARQRIQLRKDKDEKMNEQIRDMKRKAREAERWEDFKRYKMGGKPKESKTPES